MTTASTALTFPVTIPGPLLTLRDFHDGDLDGILALVGDDRVTHNLSFDTKDEPAALAYLDAAVERAQTNPRPDYFLAVIENSSGVLVGFVRLGLTGIRAADLGYGLRHACWGRGYGTEAARMMIAFGFQQLKLHRIAAQIGPDNVASQRLAERLGMQPEGRIRDHVFTNGAWRDSLTYSLLENEWPTLV
jgi:ribosomal-protein-alanine N-acetyltransferase